VSFELPGLPRISVLAVAAAGALVLLAGCGGDSPGGQVGQAAAPATPSATSGSPATSAPGRPGGPVRLYDPGRNAAADIAAALVQARRDRRQVLVDFGADWCPDCVVLHSLFGSPEVRPLLQQHYHLVAVDVGEFDHNVAVAARYVDLRRSGIPALVVLAPSGRVRFATNDGSFANARSMTGPQVRAFLARWAAG
jgi:thiol-disulfide isomerase/thioredoxin